MLLKLSSLFFSSIIHSQLHIFLVTVWKIVVILVRLFPLFTTEISYRTVEKEGVRVGQLPTQQVVSLVDLEEEKGRNKWGPVRDVIFLMDE